MARRSDEKVLLVGWDGADWPLLGPLLEAGELPQLARLVAQGVSGDLGSAAPLVPSMLWTSLATGKRPQKHGVLSDLGATAGAAQRTVRKGWAQAESSVRTGVAHTETQIKENPWAAVGIAAGVGVLLGLLINRRQ